MIFEPDGSWICLGEAGGEQWHVNGHLFDFSDRLHRVELRGSCPEDQFDQLLACFGWPETTLTFETVREGLTLNECDFRRRISDALTRGSIVFDESASARRHRGDNLRQCCFTEKTYRPSGPAHVGSEG